MRNTSGISWNPLLDSAAHTGAFLPDRSAATFRDWKRLRNDEGIAA
jgi:hypothetical protein